MMTVSTFKAAALNSDDLAEIYYSLPGDEFNAVEIHLFDSRGKKLSYDDRFYRRAVAKMVIGAFDTEVVFIVQVEQVGTHGSIIRKFKLLYENAAMVREKPYRTFSRGTSQINIYNASPDDIQARTDEQRVERANLTRTRSADALSELRKFVGGVK